MKIHIPFKTHNAIGGPSTFMSHLKRYLVENNVSIAPLNKAKILFFPISYNIKKIRHFKTKRGTKIVQRLDGVYYPQRTGADYLKRNKNLKCIYNSFSDFTIFQSEYSRDQCFAMLGKQPKSKYCIIHNGTDKNIYFPALKTKVFLKNEQALILVSTGNFRVLDMIEPAVRALDFLVEKGLNINLKLIGPIVSDELKPWFERDYINYLGPIYDNKKIADELRSSHVFLYSHLNPPCPNSVIEAISSALPVVAFDSGSMRELCYFSSELLAPTVNKLFQSPSDLKWHLLADKIELVYNQHEKFKKIADAHSYLYDFEDCAAQYINTFNKVLQRDQKLRHNIYKRLRALYSKLLKSS